MKRQCLSVISLLLVIAMLCGLAGCGTKVQAANLMEGITANSVSGKATDENFTDNQLRLAVELFKASVNESRNQNVMISPLSVQLALAMTANGADGETLKEMENLLCGDIKLNELNEYLYTYVKNLPSDKKYKLDIANSIWFRENEEAITVKKKFLQTNADYYGAKAYKSPFDDTTVKDINEWVKEHTGGLIDKIIDRISENTVMYLINALVFDAEWDTKFESTAINEGVFMSSAGQERTVDMMSSSESLYLDDGKATGFIKQYKDKKYSFAALLPNGDVDLYDYINGLTADGLKETLNAAENTSVGITMPKFTAEYQLKMNDVLAGLGIPTAFDPDKADFSKMAEGTNGNIYIGEVLHKTYISVDAKGTKAAAVTKVEMETKGVSMPYKTVRLDRPFVYMILDNSTSLPVFIGTLTDVQ